MSRRAVLSLLCAIAAACALALAIGGAGREGEAAPGFDPRIEIERLHPAFEPGEGRYVARCARKDPPLRIRAGAGVRFRVGGNPVRRGRALIRPRVRPGDNFRIWVAEGGRARTYQVRCLPADFPPWHFQRFRPVEDGLFVVSFRARPGSPQWIVAFDTGGTPRWWFQPGRRVLWAQILSDGTVSWPRAFGDGYGQNRRMAHEVRNTSGNLVRLVRARDAIVDGHELRETDGDRELVAAYVPRRADLRSVGGPRRAAIVTAEVQELDRRGNVTWRWNSFGKIALEETRLRWWARILANPRERLGGLRTFDPVHINAIEPRGRDEVVISARHTDAIYGIDRRTGEIAWKLGGRGAPEHSLKVIGDPAGRHLFGGQHDVRIADDGTLSVYDNGKLRAYDARVAFYRLRLDRGEARYLGQLDDPLVERSKCCGSARELSNGGWLVSWGKNRVLTGFDEERRIAFRLKLPGHAYRAVPVPDGAVTLAELDRGLERTFRSR